MQPPVKLLLKIAGLALLYIILYEANALLHLRWSDNAVAAIIFLPAFVRLFSFLMIGLWSILALFLAALWCIELGLDPVEQSVLALFLASGGPLGAYTACRFLTISNDLGDLTPSKLLALSVACCLGSNAGYHLGLRMIGFPDQGVIVQLTTFTGDIVGTWAIIYVLKTMLTVAPLIKRR